MKIAQTFALASALAVSGVAATAGGLSDEVVEAPIVVVEEPAPMMAGSLGSLGGASVAAIAGLLIVAALAASSGS